MAERVVDSGSRYRLRFLARIFHALPAGRRFLSAVPVGSGCRRHRASL